MKLVEVVILVGSQCLSPMESGPGLTEVGKVPCAVLVRQDPQTSEIEFVPAAAATDPDVVAMLVKPRNAIVAGSTALEQPAAGGGVTGRIPPAAPPRIVATSAMPESDAPAIARPVVKTASAARSIPRKRVVVSSRGDACGSYKAVWYTARAGHRKYRCVKVS